MYSVIICGIFDDRVNFNKPSEVFGCLLGMVASTWINVLLCKKWFYFILLFDYTSNGQICLRNFKNCIMSPPHQSYTPSCSRRIEAAYSFCPSYSDDSSYPSQQNLLPGLFEINEVNLNPSRKVTIAESTKLVRIQRDLPSIVSWSQSLDIKLLPQENSNG